MAKENPAEKIFRAWISTKKIVIADPSSASRAGLAKAIVDLGAKTSLITMCPNFETAEETIKSTNPEMVVCDYDLGGGRGLSLLQTQRQNNKEANKSLFMLVTGNTSQSAVAQAAEEDVDAFILKPYTLATLRLTLIKAAVLKIQPPRYLTVINEGKKLLEEEKYDDAIAKFVEAATLDPKPALALSYKGQAEFLKEIADEAKQSYSKGLDHNKIHYKCLVGLYDILVNQKEFSNAYELVKKISRYFPANPKRLTEVLRLAITTQSYDDIERYYQVFTTIDTRNDELVRYICAALTVTGKYYLSKNLKTRALELFNKAAMTAAGRAAILREIIQTLSDFGLHKDASKFLERYPADTRNKPEYLSMQYLVSDGLENASYLVEKGRELIKKDIHDPTIYKILIKRSFESGLKEAAESLSIEAIKRWPKQKEAFEALLN